MSRRQAPSRASRRGIRRRRCGRRWRRADVPLGGRAAGRVLDATWSKGQLPVETATPFRTGTPLAHPAGGAVDDDQPGRRRRLVARARRRAPASRRAWASRWPRRPSASAPPIDKLAFEFRGVKALVAASQAAPRALLIRYLRSIITCRSSRSTRAKLAEPGALGNVDLTVIDLDSAGPAGYELYAHLRQHPEAGSAPVLAVAQLERDRARAASLGFDEALSNPPAFAELEAAALRCLAKPIAVKLM